MFRFSSLSLNSASSRRHPAYPPWTEFLKPLVNVIVVLAIAAPAAAQTAGRNASPQAAGAMARTARSGNPGRRWTVCSLKDYSTKTVYSGIVFETDLGPLVYGRADPKKYSALTGKFLKCTEEHYGLLNKSVAGLVCTYQDGQSNTEATLQSVMDSNRRMADHFVGTGWPEDPTACKPNGAVGPKSQGTLHWVFLGAHDDSLAHRANYYTQVFQYDIGSDYDNIDDKKVSELRKRFDAYIAANYQIDKAYYRSYIGIPQNGQNDPSAVQARQNVIKEENASSDTREVSTDFHP